MSAIDPVAVAVCTCARPAGLARLLDALERQDLGPLADDRLQIVVVDNDPDGSAAPVVAAHAVRSRFAVRHVVEPRRGLSRARNAALDAARVTARAVAFVDDDEAPVPGWIAALRAAMAETGADAACGPVDPIFERQPPDWIVRGGFHAKRLGARDGLVGDGYTCNALIDLAAVDRLGLRFDLSLDETGGEDTLFFRALLDGGGRIAWAPEAVVAEWIPPAKARLGWLLRRWRRTGDVEARLGALGASRRAARLLAALRGLARIGAGGARTAVAALRHGRSDPSRAAARLYTVARGVGMVSSALGREVREYARAGRAR